MEAQERLILRRKILGLALRRAREQARKTVPACAALLGVPPARYRAYEAGRWDPSLPELEALAWFFHVPLSALLEPDGGGPAASEADAPAAVSEWLHLRHRIIGLLLRQAREQAGKSVREAAAFLGCSPHEEQVYVRLITAETLERANDLQRRVQAEGFDPVFEAVRAGQVVSATALDLGWTPVGGLSSLYGAELEKIVFATPVSATTPVIPSPVGYHLAFVAGREDRELSPYYLQARQQQAFEEWLQRQRNDPERVRYFGWQNRLPPSARRRATFR